MATNTPIFLCTLAAGMLVVSSLSAGQKSQRLPQAESAGSFDAPVKTVTVDLGPSPYTPYNPEIRNTLSCYYFPHLLIKQYDQGQVGAEWLSMFRNGGKLPDCKLSHEPGERVIKGWVGYFKGVKDDLVFFDGGEVQFGSLAFAVYDSTNDKKLFEDDADASDKEDFARLRVFSTKAGFVLKYLRTYYTGCNLHAEGRACWEEVEAKLGLKSDRMPVCTGYDTIAKLVGTDQVESWIAYPVEVTLSPHPVIRAVAGATKCWPTH